jgi:hypothetical protein
MEYQSFETMKSQVELQDKTKTYNDTSTMTMTMTNENEMFNKYSRQNTIYDKLCEIHGQKRKDLFKESNVVWMKHIDNVMNKYIETQEGQPLKKFEIIYYGMHTKDYIYAQNKFVAAYRYITNTTYCASYYVIEKEYFLMFLQEVFDNIIEPTSFTNQDVDAFDTSKFDDVIHEYLYETLRYVSIDIAEM